MADLDKLEKLLANSRDDLSLMLEASMVLHNSAPELIRRARRADALEEAMQQYVEEVNGGFGGSHWIADRADQIEKERSK